MSIAQDVTNFSDNLAQLQTDSLEVIAKFVGVVGYIWLALVIWPNTGESAPISAWVGIVLLISCSLVSYLVRFSHLQLASYLLVWGGLGATACVVLIFFLPALFYLFIIPVIFASVLLSQRSVFLVAVMAICLIVAIALKWMAIPPFSIDVILPITIIVLVTFVAWLSTRNLYTALAWVWNGYNDARRNEQLASQRQAELKRVLKALDEATYRIERSNFMLKLTSEQAEEARRLKQQFAQTISHELRTPLNLIVSFTKLMVGSPEYYGSRLSSTYLRDLNIVHRNARHLQTLVNDVLDLARIEAAQLIIVPQEVDPAALVRDAANTIRSLVETHSLTLHTTIQPDLPQLRIDPIRIRQVLFNLLNNATRFTEQGSLTVKVCQPEEDVIFSVADTGVGIAPEKLPLIFEEFQQLDGSTRRRHGGSGLGLAISRKFVELHGGRIWVESEVNKGSTFYFSLPTSRTPADPAGKLQQSTPKTVGLEPELVLLAATPSPSAAALLSRYLDGCRTVVVHNLEQARSAAQKLMPQVVVLDTACAELTPAKLERLAQEWGLPRTFFMACPLPGEELLRQQLGVDGYLLKPISHQSLWDILRQFGDKADKVLLIDDDRDFVRLISRILDHPLRRYQVIRAYNGQEGLALFRHHRPDLILLDLSLPDLNGVEVLKEIRSMPTGEHIPIIVVSAQDEIDSLESLTGPVFVAKADGLMPGEVVQWMQKTLDLATHPWHTLDNVDGYKI